MGGGGGENVTPVIPNDPLVSLGLCCRRNEEDLLEHVRRSGDALIRSDSVIVTVRKRQQCPAPTDLLAHDAFSLWANQ